MASLGSAEVAGGGGRCMLLLRLIGSLRRASRRWVKVFVVERSGYGGCLGEISGGLGRWCFGEFWGGFWESLKACGVENFEVEGDGFCAGELGCLGWFWVDAGRGRRGSGCWMIGSSLGKKMLRFGGLKGG